MHNVFSGMTLLQAAQPGAAGTSGSLVSTVVMFGALALIFYFLILRPQNKKQKQTEKMISELKKGDKVITIGGLHGLVHAVKEKTVVIKADDECKLEFSKSAISTVVNVATADIPAVEEKKEAGK